ncbi:P-loop containing nucleoside triphosphate hydrolase protein [Xylaria arbuscula]|nr:P-loop containing nucleoside triphosphate hydrolase protein [Xylaria arbuscula]
MEPAQLDRQGLAEGKSTGPWIRYRVEHRHSGTNEVMSHRDSKEPNLEDKLGDDGPNSPAFTLVTTYMIPGSLLAGQQQFGVQSMPTITSPPLYSLHLSSPAIVHALRSVVQYYPSQDLTGDVVIKWPYPILVHHYEELTQYRDVVSQKDPSNLCEREKGAYEDLGLLLQYLDGSVMPEVRKEQERNRRGFETFAYKWVRMRPGTTELISYDIEDQYRAWVIHSVTGGIFEDPPVPWTFTRWHLRYDGTYLGRVQAESEFAKFDGEQEQDGILVGDLSTSELPQIVTDQLEYGKMYWNLLRKQCKHVKGKTQDTIPKEVDSLVMVDMQSYFLAGGTGPKLLDTTDSRNWMSDCKCEVCKKKIENEENRVGMVSLFEDYNNIVPDEDNTLTDHQYLLCDFEIPAFVFKTRTWEYFHVRDLSEPRFDESLINNLVMDPKRKQTLKALAKCFSRKNKNGEQLKGGPWTADFVQGKGHGFIFLLHGRPGIGKTYTAECIAAFTKRPLMVLTPSDIGTNPGSIEINLTRNFKIAKSWDAVLLIDEADVFMERRSTADLVRNSLVAGFLRALEFYDGILFLTTNRVGSFDDAFISRVHVQMYYPDFDDEQRQQIWQTFVNKLAKERGDYMRLNVNAKEYIRGSDIQALKWNGREIRNAFQTAVSLAEYDSEKGEDGKITITDDHLRAVVELSRDFKEYLGELHRGDEAKRAERNYERLDSYAPS